MKTRSAVRRLGAIAGGAALAATLAAGPAQAWDPPPGGHRCDSGDTSSTRCRMGYDVYLRGDQFSLWGSLQIVKVDGTHIYYIPYTPPHSSPGTKPSTP